MTYDLEFWKDQSSFSEVWPYSTPEVRITSAQPSKKKKHRTKQHPINDFSVPHKAHPYSPDQTRIKLLSPAYYSSSSTSQKFNINDFVHHNTYGNGTIIAKNGSSIIIFFESGLQKDFPNPDFLANLGILKVADHPDKITPFQKATPIVSSNPTIIRPSLIDTESQIQYKPFSDTLYVYSGLIKCIRDNHMMTCVNALIDTASGETAKLNVNCCLNCNRFYISYDEYERYMAKYKSLLTRIVLVNQNGESTFTNNLAAESILKLCGYSVSQEKGLSQKERQRLLAKIIHAGIVSKPDVIQHLNWLIKMNGKKTGNDIAKEKWEEDLFFVRNLDMNTQTNHKISSVSPYSNKKPKKRY